MESWGFREGKETMTSFSGAKEKGRQVLKRTSGLGL